jgi:hypothetical protein
MQNRIVCRLRSRSDAEGHLKVLRRLMPTLRFTIIFDLTPEDEDPLPIQIQNLKSKIK